MFWQLLASCGWEAIVPQGGMSMVARPTAYEGKCIKGDAYGKEVLSSSNIRDAILKVTWLSISSSSWTGIPDYCRFMIALSDDDFIASRKALQKFNELVLGSCQASN
jgi:methionine S-methyltransferase